MGITDELRDYIKEQQWCAKGMLTAIADRIDAEHERQLEVLYRDMSDADYVELPKDADGEPIRIGDKVDSDHHEDGTVMGVQFYEMPRGIRTLVAVRPDGGDVATWHTPDEYRHHAPTVENVLRDMHMKLNEVAALHADEPTDSDERERDVERIFAEYSAKLQLRGDAE